MRRLVFPLLFSGFFCFCVGFNSNVVKADILDQLSEPGPSPLSFFTNTDLDLAQTFTAGRTGQMTQFDLYIGRSDPAPADDLIIDLRETTGGTPTESNVGGNILATVTVSPGSVSATDSWHSFDISADNVVVTAGDVYAITMRSTSTDAEPYRWLAQESNPYTDGTAFLRSFAPAWQSTPFTKDEDLAFRTFVVPEPSSVIVVSAIGLLVLRRRRR